MKKLAVLALVFLLLCGCAPREEEPGMKLWFPAAPAEAGDARPAAQAVLWEEFHPADGSAGVEELMSALLSGPEGDGLMDPFPAGVRVQRWAVEDGVLSLDLSAPYGALTGVELTLADYCITLTLCQLEGVEQVRITVDGSPLAQRSRQSFGPGDVIFTGAEEEPRQISAELYFPRIMGKGLGFETRELTLTEDDDLYLMLAQALMAGPEDPDLHTLFPEGVRVLGTWLDDGVCYVNFSAEFLSLAPETAAEQNLLLYSVVDTLGNLNSVSAVQPLVEGERVPSFGGMETNLPLEPDFGLLSAP